VPSVVVSHDVTLGIELGEEGYRLVLTVKGVPMGSLEIRSGQLQTMLRKGTSASYCDEGKLSLRTTSENVQLWVCERKMGRLTKEAMTRVLRDFSAPTGEDAHAPRPSEPPGAGTASSAFPATGQSR
jgi:hypothetical protein